MNRTERDARLLYDVLGQVASYSVAQRINAAGLTLMPVEPDDTTVEAVARAISPRWDHRPWGEVARAAYRAAVEGPAEPSGEPHG